MCRKYSLVHQQRNTKFNPRGTQFTGTKRPLHSTTQLFSPPNFSVIREWPLECFQNFRKQQIRCGRFCKTDPILLRFEATQAWRGRARKFRLSTKLCQTVFTPSGSPPPSSPAINKLRSVLDAMSPTDVGLKEENQDDDRGLDRLKRVSRWAQPIMYLNMYEGDSFTMCIFCFPTSSVIPLHDHPGMTVFSKVLYGSLHVRSYDWVEPAQEIKGPNYLPVRLAKLAVDKVLTAPCGTSVLYPRSGGNLHNFTAVTPCAVLDILTPPYREDAGRKCTYYRDYPYTAFATAATENGINMKDGREEEYAWLAETEPHNLYMRSENYRGPSIQKKAFHCGWPQKANDEVPKAPRSELRKERVVRR